MILFSLETSCDETACALFEWHNETSFTILSEQLNSQIDLHKEYGGVYPALAKREHVKNVYPLFIASLEAAGFLKRRVEQVDIPQVLLEKVSAVLERDEDNLRLLADFYNTYELPSIDAVAVTYGPGLEIALWTGFNFARALSLILNAELVPTNHMEGHIYASLIEKSEDHGTLTIPKFPALALLVSGGHTELQLINSEHEYERIGVTQDDAVGEAFDKSARLIGIDYPGGPLISKHADDFRDHPVAYNFSLPRPMMHSGDLNFSFSGLKTAVRTVVEHNKIDQEFVKSLSYELEEAIAEVLVKKTKDTFEEYSPASLILGGGVSANNTIRERLATLSHQYGVKYFIPDRIYSGDNAVMIGLAGYRRWINKKHDPLEDRVYGRLPLANG